MFERLSRLLFPGRRSGPRESSLFDLPKAVDPAVNLHETHTSGVTVHVRMFNPAERQGGQRVHGAGVDILDFVVGLVVTAALVLGGHFWFTRGGKATDAPPGPTWNLGAPRYGDLAPGKRSSSAQADGVGGARVPNAAANIPANLPQPDVPAVAVNIVPAQYTDQARAARYQGKVFVKVTIDEHGVPLQFEPTEPLPFGLDVPAGTAVMKWRFTPASLRGVPIASRTHIESAFQ